MGAERGAAEQREEDRRQCGKPTALECDEHGGAGGDCAARLLRCSTRWRPTYAFRMKIGEVARRAGVSAKTIRYYEDIRLLPEPDRSPNGYRDYDEEAVDRVRFVRDAQATGLSLTEIASILDLRQRGEATCSHVVGLLEQHLNELDRHIQTLQRTRVQLAAMTHRAKQLDPTECTDPNRCQTIDAAPPSPHRKPATHLHRAPQPHRHR